MGLFALKLNKYPACWHPEDGLADYSEDRYDTVEVLAVIHDDVESKYSSYVCRVDGAGIMIMGGEDLNSDIANEIYVDEKVPDEHLRARCLEFLLRIKEHRNDPKYARDDLQQRRERFKRQGKPFSKKALEEAFKAELEMLESAIDELQKA